MRMKTGTPLILEYVFQERVRIMEAFYGPEAETLEDDLALARRIQVTKDMMALCKKTRPLAGHGQISNRRVYHRSKFLQPF
jgi:hypothetical protein